MGKIRQVKLGDEQAELEARKKAEARRAQKKAVKEALEETAGDKKKDGLSVSGSQLSDDSSSVISSPVSQTDKPKTEKLKSENPADRTGPRSGGGRKQKTDNRFSLGSGKKYLIARMMIDKNKVYPLFEAIELIKKASFTKFDGTFEAIINATEKGIRGSVVLPHGTGKEVRVKIADDELVKNLEGGGKIDFDILVAHPSMMGKLAKVAKILGPRGLMPNPKTGTIGPEPEKLAIALSKGQIQYKTESDFPIIHSSFGKVSFESKKLEENFMALVKAVGKEKIKTLFLKSTMSPTIRISI